MLLRVYRCSKANGKLVRKPIYIEIYISVCVYSIIHAFSDLFMERIFSKLSYGFLRNIRFSSEITDMV